MKFNAATLESLLEHLGIAEAAYVGHSMGAQIEKAEEVNRIIVEFIRGKGCAATDKPFN